jgi:hypothetical protein
MATSGIAKPVLEPWLADSPEYSDLHHRVQNVYLGCKCPKNELGDYVHPNKQHSRRDHNLYRTLSDGNPDSADAKLSSHHVHLGFNVVQHIPGIVSDLPMPELLHTIHIPMHDHLQKLIFHLMKMHEQLNMYNAILLSVPAYHTHKPKDKSYEEVYRCNRKEIKEMSECLLEIVTQSLRGGNTAQHPIFNHAIECTQELLDFSMYAGYKSNDDVTLTYMEDTLQRFHTFKNVFLLRRHGKKVKPKFNALGMELVKKRKVDNETNAETYTSAKKRRKMNGGRDDISHEIDIAKELYCDFNFSKIQLLFHWAAQLRRHRALQQYSTNRHEQEHKMNLKGSWNPSNPNLNYLPQVITIQRRIVCFEIRKLNPQALAQRWEPSAAACKVLPSCDKLAAPLSPKSYGKSGFMRPQNHRDGKQPDTMIKDLRALLNIMQDTTHRAAKSSATTPDSV